MVVCKYPHLLRSNNPRRICILAMTTCFLLISHQATALSFNLTTNTNTSDIRLYGNASMTSQGIQLTRPNQTWDDGRAVYFETLHLWDQTSGNQSEFTTHFSFVVDSGGNSTYGDGLSFFLTDNKSIDSNIATGAGFGLPVSIQNATKFVPLNNFVAVEFDTFFNPEWDPPDAQSTKTHVGIDINTVKSQASMPWHTDVPSGVKKEAWISYDPSLQILSVNFTDQGNTQSGFNLPIDLKVHLPEWVFIGFGASTGDLFENHYVKSWEFNSNFIHPTTGKKKNKALLVGLTIGGSSVLVGGLALVGFLIWKKRRPDENSRGKQRWDRLELTSIVVAEEDDFETGPKRFGYEELSRATNNFSEKLGEGGFGGVYRGFLTGLNSIVAVKKISEASKQGIKEFASEVKIISQLKHRNLVKLIGWCHDQRGLLLVYEYMEKRSLDFHLFKENSLLAWAMRCKIAQGSALLYLHEECDQCVVHRDIKSSNVMVDSNFNAKLGDFGLAKLVDHEKGGQTTILAGTRGYMAPEGPEYLYTSRASKESDVYSFGVVLLEIACGRKPIDLMADEQHERMVDWVWDLYGAGQLLEAVDPKLSTNFDKEEMECMIIVGLWCAHPDEHCRPTIRQAKQALNSETPLPTLPAKMPVATYFAPESNAPSSWSISTSSTSCATISQNSVLTNPR